MVDYSRKTQQQREIFNFCKFAENFGCSIMVIDQHPRMQKNQEKEIKV